VLLSDSEFRHELEAQIEPFKGLLLGLFFIAVGMGIDLDRIAAEPWLIAAGVGILLVVKFSLLYVVGRRPAQFAAVAAAGQRAVAGR
jgi:glutathione-regulated potassium-efflux system protein KefB